MNALAPKRRFQENRDEVKAHADIAVNERIRIALETSFAELSVSLSLDAIEKQAIVGLQLLGARKLIETFLNLAELPKPVQPDKSQNLIHTV